MSGGERFNRALSKALANNPDIFILDEPTNHLDAASRDWMMNYLIKTKSTVIFISHDEEFSPPITIILSKNMLMARRK